MKCKCCNQNMHVYDQTVQDYVATMTARRETGDDSIVIEKTYPIAECKNPNCDFVDITKDVEWFEAHDEATIREMYANVIAKRKVG